MRILADVLAWQFSQQRLCSMIGNAMRRPFLVRQSCLGRPHSRVEHFRVESALNPRYERWRWQTFAITWLIYAGFYFTRQAFGVAKVALDSDPNVHLQREDLGLVDSAYLITYMLGQFLFGVLGASRSSTSVLQAWHSGQRPSQRGD